MGYLYSFLNKFEKPQPNLAFIEQRKQIVYWKNTVFCCYFLQYKKSQLKTTVAKMQYFLFFQITAVLDVGHYAIKKQLLLLLITTQTTVM